MNDNTPDIPDEAPDSGSPSNVLDFAAYKQGELEPNWPKGMVLNEAVSISASPPEPEKSKDRRILVRLEDREVVVEGHIGLTPTFLAIGDVDGQIKFAAAPGYWKSVTDITESDAV